MSRFFVPGRAAPLLAVAGLALALACPAARAQSCSYPDDYPYPNQSYTSADPWLFYYRECTSFVAWRMNRNHGTTTAPYWFSNYMMGGHWGNAANWDNNAAAIGFVVNTTPAVGAIAHWNANEGGAGAYGHVAYVEKVNTDGTVDLSEYNWSCSHCYGVRCSRTVPRYIHVSDATGGPPTQIGDFVQVYGTGGSGLRVRNPEACGTSTSSQNRADGDIGYVVDGPVTCTVDGGTATRWKVLWAKDCLVGWSAQDWMQKIPAVTPFCTRFTLTLSVNPAGAGSVNANPVPDADGKYASGTVVQLTANPAAGYAFTSWSGNASGSANPVSVTLNSNKAVTANFLLTTLRPKGADFSHWNGTITPAQWTQIYNGGFVFAWTKATESTSFIDSTFVNNMTRARAAGIYIGAYHFARPASNTAVAEANHFVNVARAYLTDGYLRPALDLEDGASLGRTALSNWTNAWIDSVKQQTGVEPVLYCNTNYATNYLNSTVASRTLWIAQWPTDPDPQRDNPDTGVFPTWHFWQFGGGPLPGMTGSYDNNVFNGTLAQLQNFVISGGTMNDSTPTGENLALFSRQWSADSSFSAAFDGSKAIDGVIAADSKWTSNGNAPPHWLALDLGATRTVNGFIIRHAGAGGEDASYNTKIFAIQSGSSLAGPWTDETLVNNAAQASVTTRTYITPKPLRYVRLQISDAGVDNYARIAEFEVWGPPVPRPGDFDGDRDVDQTDFGAFQACMLGPAIPQNDPACLKARLDADDDVDLSDFGLFQRCLSGPNVPADPYCAD